MTSTVEHSSLLKEDLIGFPELFKRSVEQWPHAQAIVFGDTVVTYAELNAYANRIAHLLLGNETIREQRIGLCLDRSHHAIAAMIGIMKAGAAFVPLDPEFPVDRLAYIVEDAGIEQIICSDDYRELFIGCKDAHLIDLEIDLATASTDQDPSVNVDPDQLAYIMYTSGSTGNPKGVQIEHCGLATYCFADIEVYDVVKSDRTLQFSTINFDIAIEEIFPPLLVGSCVVVRPSQRADSQNELSSIIETYGVTAVHIATAYWHEWVDLMRAAKQSVPESIRLMVVTGEKVSTEHVRRWHELCDQDVLWCNAYGPTEATVSATVFIPPRGWDGDNMPIGKPLKRYTGHILDADGKPVDEGETGELLIGGPALARGYLNRDDLTEAAFVTLEIDGKPTRLYRSGDLARWLPNGDIEFAGRIDHQIKLGSYRIEPGEIEAAVNTHPDVLESLVSYDEIDGKKFLIAYVANGTSSLELSDLATHLRDQLPPYMVPTRFVVLERFPKTINGKVDRRALPDPSTSQVARLGNCDAPETELQTELVRIWTDVLNVPNVGIYDDFFALGGSSLLVTRIIMQIQSQLDIEIPVRDFFANPTIASSAQHLERLVNGDDGTDTAEADNAARSQLRNSLPQILPTFIPSGKHQLFTVHYAPVTSVPAADHAVLLCGAYGHEYQRSHRNLQQLAVVLARSGFHVLRFDYAGTGNSSGSTTDSTVEQWQTDIETAAAHLRSVSGISTLSTIGLRLGATLAATAELQDLTNLILWDPVDGNEMCQQFEHLHEYALRSFRRFNTPFRKAEPNQLFGHAMTPRQRIAIEELRLSAAPAYTSTLATVVTCINSREYPVPSYPAAWNQVAIEDEIYWTSPSYTESAFSSPTAYRTILDTLNKGLSR